MTPELGLEHNTLISHLPLIRNVCGLVVEKRYPFFEYANCLEVNFTATGLELLSSDGRELRMAKLTGPSSFDKTGARAVVNKDDFLKSIKDGGISTMETDNSGGLVLVDGVGSRVVLPDLSMKLVRFNPLHEPPEKISLSELYKGFRKPELYASVNRRYLLGLSSKFKYDRKDGEPEVVFNTREGLLELSQFKSGLEYCDSDQEFTPIRLKLKTLRRFLKTTTYNQFLVGSVGTRIYFKTPDNNFVAVIQGQMPY